MLSIRLDISFVMLLILLSTVSLSLLKSNQASGISVGAVGAILGLAKEAFDDFVPSIVSVAQSLGIAPKADTTTTAPPPPPSSNTGDLKQEISQLRQEYRTKLNTISSQLAALNENDQRIAKEQLAQTYKQALSHYSVPEQSFIQNTTRELAPQLQSLILKTTRELAPQLQNVTSSAVCSAFANGGSGGPVTTTNSGPVNCTGPHSCTWTSSGGPGGNATSKCGPGGK